MKKIISLLFVLVLNCKLVLAAENVCQNAEADTSVMFGNGVMGTTQSAVNSIRRLESILQSSLPPDQFKKNKV